MSTTTWLVLLLSSVAGVSVHAETSGVDKAQYTIFNPTPRDKMRELSTDRPDRTESPYSVDAGHFQIETDLVIYSLDRAQSTTTGEEIRTTSTGFLVNNVKVGLTNNMDLQAIFATHQIDEVKETNQPTDKRSGFGDTLVRLKINLMGNDGGDFAVGVMPYVNIPTNTGNLSHKRVEAGFAVPFAMALPSDWSLGWMFQFDRVSNEADDKFHSQFVSTVTLGHDIVGDLAGYMEFYSESSNEEGAQWIATADFGLTYGANENLQFDAGANIGVTRATDDIQPFIGVSARF